MWRWRDDRSAVKSLIRDRFPDFVGCLASEPEAYLVGAVRAVEFY